MFSLIRAEKIQSSVKYLELLEQEKMFTSLRPSEPRGTMTPTIRALNYEKKISGFYTYLLFLSDFIPCFLEAAGTT